MKPGGTLIVSTPQGHSVVSSIERCYHRLRSSAGQYQWWDPTHTSVRRRRDLLRLFDAADLAVVREVGLHLAPEVIVRRLPTGERLEWTRHEGHLRRFGFDLVFALAFSGS